MAPAAGSIDLRDGRSIVVQAQAGRHVAKVAISTEPIGKGSNLPGFFDDPKWYAPRTQIQKLTITVDGRDLIVPITAVADIYDPKSIHVRSIGKGFRLDIEAADAAEYYKVSLYFDAHRVLRRSISNSDRMIEEDRYF